MYESYIEQLLIEAKLRNLADSSTKTYKDFILRFLQFRMLDGVSSSSILLADFVFLILIC